MNKHETRSCPNCNRVFECKSNKIQNCQCETVQLTQPQRDYIATQYDDCLCANCLKELRSQFNIGQSQKTMRDLTSGSANNADNAIYRTFRNK